MPRLLGPELVEALDEIQQDEEERRDAKYDSGVRPSGCPDHYYGSCTFCEPCQRYTCCCSCDYLVWYDN